MKAEISTNPVFLASKLKAFIHNLKYARKRLAKRDLAHHQMKEQLNVVKEGVKKAKPKNYIEEQFHNLENKIAVRMQEERSLRTSKTDKTDIKLAAMIKVKLDRIDAHIHHLEGTVSKHADANTRRIKVLEHELDRIEKKLNIESFAGKRKSLQKDLKKVRVNILKEKLSIAEKKHDELKAKGFDEDKLKLLKTKIDQLKTEVVPKKPKKKRKRKS